MNDIAAFGLQRPRFYEHFESGLGPETRHALGEAEFGGFIHPAFLSVGLHTRELLHWQSHGSTRFPNTISDSSTLAFGSPGGVCATATEKLPERPSPHQPRRFANSPGLRPSWPPNELSSRQRVAPGVPARD